MTGNYPRKAVRRVPVNIVECPTHFIGPRLP